MALDSIEKNIFNDLTKERIIDMICVGYVLFCF